MAAILIISNDELQLVLAIKISFTTNLGVLFTLILLIQLWGDGRGQIQDGRQSILSKGLLHFNYDKMSILTNFGVLVLFVILRKTLAT